MSIKSKAFLFGLNYAGTPSALQGCINDVKDMADFLGTKLKIPCEVYTDETTPESTTAQGLIGRLMDITLQSWSDNLEFIWIHYSGHGSYIRDTNRDELDGQDECLVPSDYAKSGMISDDMINIIFRRLNPKTRVVCVFDCCHSGTIADVKYRWEDERRCSVENIMCQVRAKVMTFSGCMDSQTSADAFNVDGTNKWTGALTSCLLEVLKSNPKIGQDVFLVLTAVRKKLIEKRFDQVPKVCSTYNLAKSRSMVP